jgi:hypothetical protein
MYVAFLAADSHSTHMPGWRLDAQAWIEDVAQSVTEEIDDNGPAGRKLRRHAEPKEG